MWTCQIFYKALLTKHQKEKHNMEKKGIFLEIKENETAELTVNGEGHDLIAALAMALTDKRSELKFVVTTAIKFLKEVQGIDIFAEEEKEE